MRLTVRAHGPVDPAEVWERYAVPARWHEWSPQIAGVTCGADRLAAGVTGRVHPLLGPWIGFVVDDWDEDGRTWSWTARRGPICLRLAHGVTARADGTTTWLRVDAPLPIALGYLPLARLALHRLVH